MAIEIAQLGNPVLTKTAQSVSEMEILTIKELVAKMIAADEVVPLKH